MFVIPEGGEWLHMAYIDVAPEGDSNGRTGLLLHGRNFPWKLIKPKVLNQPGNDPGIVADAHFRLNRFLPVLDKQLEWRDEGVFLTGWAELLWEGTWLADL